MFRETAVTNFDSQAWIGIFSTRNPLPGPRT